MFPLSPTWISFSVPSSKDIVEGNLERTRTTDQIVLTVFPSWYEHCDVSWTFPDTWENPVFNVFKSGSEEGPFVKLNPTPVHEDFFQDIHFESTSKFNNEFYVVEAILESGEKFQSLPESWDSKRHRWVELRALEIQRRSWLLLRKFVGVESWIFKRRVHGPRCPRCWDERSHKSLEDHCPVCYGTSFEGGYWKPLRTFLQYDPSSNNTDFQDYGKMEVNSLSAWTISLNELSPLDLVWKKDENKMFRIFQTQRTELQTAPVRQILGLVELDKEMIEYKLPEKYLS